MEPIDIVIPWVDGSDPAWLAEKAIYDGSSGDAGIARFRDCGTLKYTFRSIEKFAPWVRKIHFVTWGHVPEWMDTSNEKLHIVNHKDYIPAEYLPTFNSHTIELNFHRIEGLSENFVYFNDDIVMLKPTDETFFFKNGLPCDSFAMDAIYFGSNSIGWINGSNTAVINDNFNMRQVVKRNWRKVFHLAYGLKKNLKNLIFYFICKWFPGFHYWHVTSAFQKHTFQEVWDVAGPVLDETCRCRFREKTNVNQYLIKNWQLARGKFIPSSLKTGRCYHLDNLIQVELLYKAIRKQQYNVVCINDTLATINVPNAYGKIQNALDSILFEKSSFELYDI